MPFIGNQPALSYTSFAKQDFTTSATTSYTLDNPVANENELALFINFVRQEPTTAYTASGTSLTLTSATSASDDMYCVYLGKAVQTVNPPNGSVGTAQLADSSVSLAKLSATGTKDATTFLRGDNTFASAGGTNTPAFRVFKSSNQTPSAQTSTLVTFDTETFDTNSAFASNTFTIPSGEAGKYYLNANINIDGGADGFKYFMYLIKNGTSAIGRGNVIQGSDGEVYMNTSTIIDASVGDDFTVEVWLQQSQVVRGNQLGHTYFEGFKLVE